MNFIGNELKKEDPAGTICSYIHLNCQIIDTPYGILYDIGKQTKTVEDNVRMPFTGWSIEKIYSEIRKHLDEQNKVFIVVLDEVDHLVKKKNDDVLYHLSKMNEDFKRSKLSLVGISNDLQFMESLDSRIKSRLGEEKIIFHHYNAPQLEDILRSRAKLAFEEGVLEDDVIPFCAELSAQEMGDARRAIALLRVSAEAAERNGDSVVTEAHVRYAKNKIESDVVTEVVKALTLQSQTVLMSIIHNTKNDNKVMTTGEVYSIYKELCSILQISVLTQRRITDLISELDMLGIIHAQVKSSGRAGRTKEIELSISKEVCKVLENSEGMKPLKTRRSPTQTKLL
ncbi:MAG: AAA family ATPase, partial [Methanomassiliicoccaceae archaeon]|nr:AAA family ATPase [Methanomassiliicoccaceae archaeon]